MIDYILFASGGNDSVMLAAYARHEGLKNVVVCYSDTGWASPEWPARMKWFGQWVRNLGFTFVEVHSEGFSDLVRRKKGFPANRPKFCTYELKIKPATEWMELVDPDKNATCMVGIRREESAARKAWPEYIESSPSHGGRPLWSPLVKFTTAERNALLEALNWKVLPYRSKECSPCVNSNRTDFRALAEVDIQKVETLEAEMHRTMFRTKKFMGATGIREVMKWAWSERGKYEAPEAEPICDSGHCGD